MRRGLSIVACVAAASACALDPDYGATRFQCDETPQCPGGFTCLGGECRPQGSGGGAPEAAFTSDASFLSVSFDATGSSPGGAPIDSYAWSFGDDATGTGATVSHTYDQAGTYEITLTVTDEVGQTDTISNEVTVVAPPQPLAADDFEREVDLGWGMADDGGTWIVTGATESWSVDGGAGRVSIAAGVGPNAHLSAVAAESVDLMVTVSTDRVVEGGSGLYSSMVARRVAGVGNYSLTVVFRADRTIDLVLGGRYDNADFDLDSSYATGLTYDADDRLRARVQVWGTNPTQLRARVWHEGDEEPGEWQVMGEDDRAELQAPGSVAIYQYLSASTMNGPVIGAIDDVYAVPVE